jgi:hypothetical protein
MVAYTKLLNINDYLGNHLSNDPVINDEVVQTILKTTHTLLQTKPPSTLVDTAKTMEGRCQCGLIKFTTPLSAPQQLLICHCTECRHQSSSTYGMTAIFPSFEIKPPFPGAIATFSRPNSNGETKGFFCTRCGARLMHQSISRDGKPAAAVSVKSGCLDGITREMMRGAVHIWTRSAIVDIPDDAEAYEGEPPGGSFSHR